MTSCHDLALGGELVCLRAVGLGMGLGDGDRPAKDRGGAMGGWCGTVRVVRLFTMRSLTGRSVGKRVESPVPPGSSSPFLLRLPGARIPSPPPCPLGSRPPKLQPLAFLTQFKLFFFLPLQRSETTPRTTKHTPPIEPPCKHKPDAESHPGNKFPPLSGRASQAGTLQDEVQHQD
ncbi:hypothetical protein BJ508DRAFT_180979 [Ascobolus immersus RN42]|uniref:Uncharacterized protein n=1 Tax=Ascobolus immersus RN42 TaxID=1160509 RepID=A0A3N4HSL3_ASCIM|nr:hypothetical protein BJ508DRAFT_180979 [Ascobolus immersus RN42]